MDFELRLRPCARPACNARRNASSTGSCCDEKCLEAISQASITQGPDNPGHEARLSPRNGIQHSLAHWKAALERAECLCTKMLRIGLPSCCVSPAPEIFPVRNQTLANPKKCYSTASLEKLDPEATTSKPRSRSSATSSSNKCCSSTCIAKKDCCSTPSPKACCSSSPTAKTDSCFTPGPKTCGSAPPTAQMDCCSTPGSKTCCSSPADATSNISAPATERNWVSALSTKTVQPENFQRSGSPDDCKPFTGHQSVINPAIDLEKGLGVKHVVIQVSGMTCTGCERKLERVLSSIRGVHNVKTSLVLGRAEFDADVGLPINDVAILVERQSEFKCVVHQEGHQLEVCIPEGPSTQAMRPGTAAVASDKGLTLLLRGLIGSDYPFGVEDVKIVDSKGREWKSETAVNRFRQHFRSNIFSRKPHKLSARISYNPHVIGARDLLEKGFGTPLALTSLSTDHAAAADADHLRQTLYLTLLSAILTIPVLIMAWAPLPIHKLAYESSSLALATLVQVIIAGPFYPKALKALLFSGMIEMDLLIVLSTTTAYVFSVVAYVFEINGHPLSTAGFFQTSTLLVTLIMCGRLASAYARRKAADSISLHALQPSTAVISENGNEKPIDVREFQYGDLFRVLPDSIVPTDGVIVSGETEIDESMINGEATPLPKFPGSHIIAGSINGSGPVLARLTKLPIDNTISRIAQMVDAAKVSKPRVQETADRVASYFVPCILVVTIAVFSIWTAVGVAVRGSSASDAIVTAITYALAALVVSCPCAIGLAVPMVMVIAGGVGAKHGVIFKLPEAIAKARNTSHVVFDKTGTLTQGKFVVVEEICRGENRNQIASIAHQLTFSSKHPVSQALATHLESRGKCAVNLASISSVVGRGMHATLDGESVRGGNPLYVDVVEDPDVRCLSSQGLTIFCLRQGSVLLAIYGLRDTLRTDTASVVSALQARNVLVSIVSGDSITAVDRLATELGIPLSHAKGQCTPEDKARYITSLSAAPPGRKRESSAAITVFCGDGSNDAIALAQADIGIHMAGGTEVAKSAADVVLMHKSLSGILVLMDLSRACMRRVYLNFAWSFVYNLFAILLAAGAFVTVRIPPAYAGLGELVSVLPVIAVAMQLRWMKFRWN